MERDAQERAAALDRYWDDLVAERAAERPPDVDEVYAATMHRVSALGDVPGLEAARTSVWQSLSGQSAAGLERTAPPHTVPLAVSIPVSGPNGRSPHPAPLRPSGHPASPRRLSSVPASWVLAALLLLTAAAGLVALGQSRDRPEAIVMTAPQLMGWFESIWRTTGGATPLGSPQGLAVDPKGNLWVVDAGGGQFQIFAPDGTFLESWGAIGTVEVEVEFNFSVSNESEWGGYRGDIAFDAAGNLYVVDVGNQRIQKFAPDRSFLRAWGSAGDDDGQFLTPLAIAIGPDGSVYVSDGDRGDVQKFDSDGRFLAVTGTYELEDGKPSAASGVAVDGRGFVWVADQANHRIARFSPEGFFLDAWGVRGTRPGEVFNPRDIAIDGAGLVYVIDSNVHRIQLFAPNGRFLAETRSNPANPESFTAPQAVTLGRDGTVFITDDFAVHALRAIEHIGDALMPPGDMAP
jgi:DNA-binding beta-propeller fold protein YncE